MLPAGVGHPGAAYLELFFTRGGNFAPEAMASRIQIEPVSWVYGFADDNFVNFQLYSLPKQRKFECIS